MALSIIEQLNILKGVVAPTDASLDEIVGQVALVSMIDFRDNHSNPSGSTEATSYVTKMLSIALKIFRTNPNLTANLSRMVIGIYAPIGSYAAVQVANDDAWVGFVENNMTEVLEQFIEITQEEKTAYEAL